MRKNKALRIRNSTAEFLVFTRQAGDEGIEVRVAEETVWLTQKLISVLFDKGRSTITEHLNNIFESGELDEKSSTRRRWTTMWRQRRRRTSSPPCRTNYTEDQAERGIPMTMQDWAAKLNAFLQFNERDLLDHPGKVSAEVAKAFAESEFEKYRVIQDRLFESDFDRAIKRLPPEGEEP